MAARLTSKEQEMTSAFACTTTAVAAVSWKYHTASAEDKFISSEPRRVNSFSLQGFALTHSKKLKLFDKSLLLLFTNNLDYKIEVSQNRRDRKKTPTEGM